MMDRLTIDFGIFLGNENCAVAVFNGQQAEMIKNNEGLDFTPSVVTIDKNGNPRVGRHARQRLKLEPDDAHADILLQIGTGTVFRFARSGQELRAEELAAELLKSLSADVKQRLGEDLQAAVITVPAAFELSQCEAVQRAARIAGIKLSPLILEPVAAAAAYAYQERADREFWLVYQLRGGTFDVAVVEVCEGEFRVAQHGGDNHTGDKLIDWEIVDKLLAPAVARDHQLSDFVRSNPHWRKAFAKLKQEAEEARIRLIQSESTQIVIDFLCKDANGDPVAFEHELRRSEVVALAKPIVQRTIDICRQVLAEAGLDPSSLQKAILVGAPALSPFVRDQLSDRRQGLGIPLEYSIDPMTVIAQGAAIYAGRLPLAFEEATQGEGETFTIELNIDALDEGDTEPIVSGRVQAPGEKSPLGYQLEFSNPSLQPPWRSGKRTLGQDGSFITALWIRQGYENTLNIELSDKSGRRCLVTPDQVTLPVAQPQPPAVVTAQTVRLPAEALEAGVEAQPSPEVLVVAEQEPQPTLPSAKLLEPDLFKTDLVQAITPQPPAAQIELPEPEQPVKTPAATPQAADTVRIAPAAPQPALQPPAPSRPESPPPAPAPAKALKTRPLAPEPGKPEEALVVEKPVPPPEPEPPAPPPQPPDTHPLEEELTRLKNRLQSLQDRLDQTGSPVIQSLLQSQVEERQWLSRIEEKITAAAQGDYLAADQAANLISELSSILAEIEQQYEGVLQAQIAAAERSATILIQAASSILAERADLINRLQAIIDQGQNQEAKSRLDDLQTQIQAGVDETDLNHLESLVPQLVELIASAENELSKIKVEILKQTHLARRTP